MSTVPKHLQLDHFVTVIAFIQNIHLPLLNWNLYRRFSSSWPSSFLRNRMIYVAAETSAKKQVSVFWPDWHFSFNMQSNYWSRKIEHFKAATWKQSTRCDEQWFPNRGWHSTCFWLRTFSTSDSREDSEEYILHWQVRFFKPGAVSNAKFDFAKERFMFVFRRSLCIDVEIVFT